MIHRVVLVGIGVVCLSAGIVASLPATGIETASRLYLNHTLFHLRQAQRYASRSYETVPLGGLDYDALQRDLDLVADGIAAFLHPRHGDPVRVVPTQIDGRYLAEAVRAHRLPPSAPGEPATSEDEPPVVLPEVLE